MYGNRRAEFALKVKKRKTRPQKDGERYPGGQLKPKPQPVVLEPPPRMRVHRYVDLHALDCAFELGLISEEHSRTGWIYASIYYQQLAAKRVSRNTMFASLTEERAEAFNRLLDRREGLSEKDRDRYDRSIGATWTKINAAMSDDERVEVEDMCDGSWPRWMRVMLIDESFGPALEPSRRLLISGLAKIEAALSGGAQRARAA